MTVTVRTTLKSSLNFARPGQLSDILAKIKLGTMLTPTKRVFTGLTSGTSFNLTQIDGVDEIIGPSNPLRLPLLQFNYLQVVTGTAPGTYVLGPPDATMVAAGAGVGVARLSDDGSTLTFPSAVTAFTIAYMPQSSVDMLLEQPALDGAP